MPPPDSATTNTPLAPSVEKAYYRKCIELKRRLNEVEAANDEAKIKRVRLDRGIHKMRLERAILLERLDQMMQRNGEVSEGDEDNDMPEPPAARPHRDRRQRPQHPLQPAQILPSQPSFMPQHQIAPAQPIQRHASDHAPAGSPSQSLPGSGSRRRSTNNGMPEGDYGYVERAGQATFPPHQPQTGYYTSMPLQHYGAPPPAPVGVPGATSAHANGMSLDGVDDRDRNYDAERDHTPLNREAGAAGEAVPVSRQEANGNRRIITSSSRPADMDDDQGDRSGDRGGFTVVNRQQ